jgi:hypothetical protein
MKSKHFVTGLIVITLLLVLTSVVSAAAPAQPVPAPTPPDFAELFAQWVALAGVGALIAVLINVGKVLGWVQEGQSTTWSTGLNIVGMVALLLLQIFKPDMDIAALDGAAGQIAQALVILVGLVTQMLSSKGAHFALKGTPVIGKSFSVAKDDPGS